MLSTGAFNALLKTLEEPPSHVVFILCTTDPRKVLPTIVSRCQRFDFHRIGVDEIASNLRMIAENEGIQYEDVALETIARNSLGGMRDAITTFEQLSVFTHKNITAQATEELLGEVEESQLSELCGLIATRDLAGCFNWVSAFVQGGTDIADLAHDLTAYIRDLYVVTLTGGTGIEGPRADELDVYKSRARLFEGPERLARILTILSDLNMELRNATDPRLSLEIALTRMAHPTTDLTLESLSERIEKLEAMLTRLRMEELPQQTQVPAAAAPAAPAPTASSKTISPAPAPAPKAASAPKAEPASKAAPAPAASVETEPPAAPAPAPEPAAPEIPAPPAMETAVTLDQATVTRKWGEAARVIGGKKANLSGTISSIRALLADTGDSIFLELPQGSAFTYRKLEDAENKQLISDCIARAFGQPIRYKLVVSESAPPPPPAMPVEDAPSTELFEAVAPAPEPEDQPAEFEAPEPEQAPEPVPAASEPEPVSTPASAAPAPELYDEYVYDDDDEDEYVPDFDDAPYDDGFTEGFPTDGTGEDIAENDSQEAGDDDASEEVSDELPPDLANMIFGAFDRAHDAPTQE